MEASTLLRVMRTLALQEVRVDLVLEVTHTDIHTGDATQFHVMLDDRAVPAIGYRFDPKAKVGDAFFCGVKGDQLVAYRIEPHVIAIPVKQPVASPAVDVDAIPEQEALPEAAKRSL